MRPAILLVLSLLWSASAFASHLPLVEGAVWNYSGYQGQSVQRTVHGTQLVGAATTSVIENFRSGGFEDEWWNFWTVDGQGRVFLHGFRNVTAGLGVRYDPPILWIAPGETSWGTLTVARDLDTDVVVEALDVQIAAVADVSLDVPAGSFSTLFLDVNIQSVEPVKTLRFDVLGRSLSDDAAGKRVSNQLWYAQGVGLVRESYCCPLSTEELFSYQVVATETFTWSGVKDRYDR